MTSKTKSTRNPQGCFSVFRIVSLITALAMSAVVTIYSCDPANFIYQHGGAICKLQRKLHHNFLANDEHVSFCCTCWPLDFLVIS